jgi:hypothetical protein
MAAEQYGDSTNNYQIVWSGGRWIITNDSELAASDVVTVAYEISAAAGTTVDCTGAGAVAITGLASYNISGHHDRLYDRYGCHYRCCGDRFSGHYG